MAPSAQAKKNEFPKDEHVNVYCHWFALELSKLWDYLKWTTPSQNDSINVQIDGEHFTIDPTSLSKTVSCIENACTEFEAKGCNLESFTKFEMAMTS